MSCWQNWTYFLNINWFKRLPLLQLSLRKFVFCGSKSTIKKAEIGMVAATRLQLSKIQGWDLDILPMDLNDYLWLCSYLTCPNIQNNGVKKVLKSHWNSYGPKKSKCDFIDYGPNVQGLDIGLTWLQYSVPPALSLHALILALLHKGHTKSIQISKFLSMNWSLWSSHVQRQF